jgi:hypothetical protein
MDYLERESKRLRTAGQRKSILERLVYPAFGNRPIGDIKRTEIVDLLDQIEDQKGGRAAEMTLAVLGAP